MLRPPGMVWGKLNGKTKRDLKPVLGARFDQGTKIVERSKLGVHAVMSPLARAERIGASGIARLGLQRIVAAFPIDSADGMYGREIKNVETQCGDVGQPWDTIAP